MYKPPFLKSWNTFTTQVALLTNSARKRRKQEFKKPATRILVKNELKNSDENNKECGNENEIAEVSGEEYE